LEEYDRISVSVECSRFFDQSFELRSYRSLPAMAWCLTSSPVRQLYSRCPRLVERYWIAVFDFIADDG
jgi:hypothetical protein